MTPFANKARIVPWGGAWAILVNGWPVTETGNLQTRTWPTEGRAARFLQIARRAYWRDYGEPLEMEIEIDKTGKENDGD